MRSTTDIRRQGELSLSERQRELLRLSEEQRERLRERDSAWEGARDDLTHSSIPSPTALSRTAPQQARQQPAKAASLRDSAATAKQVQFLADSARIHIRNGQFATALDLTREALALQPQNPMLRADLEYLEYAKWYSQQTQPLGSLDRYARSNATDLILDALDSTKKGNLIGAIAYLEDQMLRHEGDTTYALSALSYLEGLYQSYVYIGEAALGAQKRREERERAKAWAIQARGRKLFDPTANDSFKLLQYRMTPPEEKPVLDIIAELFVKGFLKTGELFEKATKPFYRKQTESLVSLSDPTNKNLLSPPPPIQPDLAWRWEEKTRPRLVGTRTRRSRAISEAAKRATTYVELIRHLEEQAAETRAVDHESYGPDDAAHAISYLQGQAAYFDLLLDAYR